MKMGVKFKVNAVAHELLDSVHAALKGSLDTLYPSVVLVLTTVKADLCDPRRGFFAESNHFMIDQCSIGENRDQEANFLRPGVFLGEIFPEEGLPACDEQTETPCGCNLIGQGDGLGSAQILRTPYLILPSRSKETMFAPQIAAVGQLETS
jgi:hypothetical protein